MLRPSMPRDERHRVADETISALPLQSLAIVAGSIVQTSVSIAVEPGWTGELTFQPGNGTAVRLPADEIDVTALNELIYQPAEGKTIERLPEGTTSCVLATIWDQVRGREATEKVDQWCFAVT